MDDLCPFIRPKTSRYIISSIDPQDSLSRCPSTLNDRFEGSETIFLRKEETHFFCLFLPDEWKWNLSLEKKMSFEGRNPRLFLWSWIIAFNCWWWFWSSHVNGYCFDATKMERELCSDSLFDQWVKCSFLIWRKEEKNLWSKMIDIEKETCRWKNSLLSTCSMKFDDATRHDKNINHLDGTKIFLVRQMFFSGNELTQIETSVADPIGSLSVCRNPITEILWDPFCGNPMNILFFPTPDLIGPLIWPHAMGTCWVP